MSLVPRGNHLPKKQANKKKGAKHLRRKTPYYQSLSFPNPFHPALLPQLKSESKVQFLVSPSGRQYTLHYTLGQGSYGTVYKASCVMQNILLPQAVAVKVSKDADAIAAQLQEERVADLLRGDNNEHTVEMLEGFSCGNCRYTVYELLSQSLQSLINSKWPKKCFSLKQIRIIATQLLNTLALLSKEKIIHGDLKPENVLLKDPHSLELRLSDYGSSHLAGDPFASIIQTPNYRAPEVAMDLKYDEKIDMWSLGCLLVELYMGKKLFSFPRMEDSDSQNEHFIRNKHLLIQIAKKVAPIPPEWLKAKPQFSEDADFQQQLNEVNTDSLKTIWQKLQLPSPEIQPEKNAFFDFISKMLVIKPHFRISAEQALAHSFITIPWKPRKEESHAPA